jgi:hypothetical protein
MADTYPNKPFKNYYYGEQILHYILQFMSIFSGLQVSIGKNDYESSEDLIYVPIRYGSRDRVVEWIKSGQTTNKPLRLPIMGAKVMGVDLAPELRKGMGQESARSYLPRGGALPNDIKVIRQMQPNPCRLNMELTVLTSNTKNRFEILEQILLLFDPDIQIFTSDDFNDSYKISRVELITSSFEDEYPIGTGNPINTDTFNFTVYAAFRPPIDMKESYVKSIRIRLDAISNLPVDEAVVELNNIGTIGDILFDIDDLDIPEN